jgi:hypothetical protein
MASGDYHRRARHGALSLKLGSCCVDARGVTFSFRPDRADILVQLPEEKAQRRLHPAKHTGSEGRLQRLELSAPLLVEAGQELFVYYEELRRFVQQPVRVDQLDETGLSIWIEPMAAAIPAESRQSYRCPTLVEDISATLGAEADCEVLDVSETGFAVHARTRHELGTRLPAAVRFEGLESEGHVIVQSSRARGSRWRYGLRVVGGELQEAIARISLDVQRRQLRRRSGGK